MINIPTEKDLQDIWTKLIEVMDRTKRQTKQIQELQMEVKKLKNGEK